MTSDGMGKGIFPRRDRSKDQDAGLQTHPLLVIIPGEGEAATCAFVFHQGVGSHLQSALICFSSFSKNFFLASERLVFLSTQDFYTPHALDKSDLLEVIESP